MLLHLCISKRYKGTTRGYLPIRILLLLTYVEPGAQMVKKSAYRYTNISSTLLSLYRNSGVQLVYEQQPILFGSRYRVKPWMMPGPRHRGLTTMQALFTCSFNWDQRMEHGDHGTPIQANNTSIPTKINHVDSKPLSLMPIGWILRLGC